MINLLNINLSSLKRSLPSIKVIIHMPAGEGVLHYSCIILFQKSFFLDVALKKKVYLDPVSLLFSQKRKRKRQAVNQRQVH